MSIIYVPSEAQRAKMADDAIVRHNNLTPQQYDPLGVYKCCDVLPEYRNGGAVLGSFTCPICKRHQGIWSQNFRLILNNWNSNIANPHWESDLKYGKPSLDKFNKGLSGFIDGWRYIRTVYIHFSHNCYEVENYYGYNDYINNVTLSDQIVRYNVETNHFEFLAKTRDGQNKIIVLKYNPPKSGGNIGYSIPDDYIIDNDKKHKFAEYHCGISFSANNYKWSSVLRNFVEELKQSE